MSSNKLTIIPPGTAREEAPILSKMREFMPEPARVAYAYLRTVEPAPVPSFSCQEFSADTIIRHEWEKILVREDGVRYWAWQHLGTGDVFL